MRFKLLEPSGWSAANKILTDVFIGEGFVSSSLADKLSVEGGAESGTWIGAFDQNETLVGLVLYTTFGTKAARVARPDGAEIRLLAVVPECRGSGAGSGLVEFAEGLAQKTDATTLALSTQETMVAAQRLYHRLGYKKISEQGYVSMEKRFVVFEKRLDTHRHVTLQGL